MQNRRSFVILTFYFGFVFGGLPHQQSSSFTVQRICWVGVAKKLWQEDLKDVDHIYFRRKKKKKAVRDQIDFPG